MFQNKLIKKGSLNSPVAECSPVIWKGRLYLVECWQRLWDYDPKAQKDLDYVQVRNVEKNEIVAVCMEKGYCYASAFVWDDTFYVFAAQWKKTPLGSAKQYRPHNVSMTESSDLVHWSEPRVVLEEEFEEEIANQTVCYDGKQFVMVYESIEHPLPPGAPCRFKFARSTDLRNWTKVPDLIFGGDRYVGCPSIRYMGDYYYMPYLARIEIGYVLPDPKQPYAQYGFATHLTRSKDLVTWEEAPHNPVIAPDPTAECHPFYYERRDPRVNKIHDPDRMTRQINASDTDLVEWRGKTIVYFTGGCQIFAGDLQYAEFEGTMQDFFESYYVD